MPLLEFEITALPQIIFGQGSIEQLPELILEIGHHVLIVTGAASFQSTTYWEAFQTSLQNYEIQYQILNVSNEPTTQFIDVAVSKFTDNKIDVVIGIGGGSVLDAAKAIAGLLPFGHSILDHLEGVGKGIEYTGPALPFIAVPTTAGTGSEATKNAVISQRGANGYKKSFRHDSLIAQKAIIDPNLLITCSASQIAANGMDALTQLMESYVSLKANRLTDALVIDGIKAVIEGFQAAWKGGGTSTAAQGRNNMCYAALLSGITLAQVGLGSVHGLASPLGAFFPIPHGVVCGCLIAVATQENISAMLQRDKNNSAITKYAELGRLLSDKHRLESKLALVELVRVLQQWTTLFEIPKLSKYGVKTTDIPKIVADSRGSSMKTNPIILTDSEIENILRQSI